MMRYAVSNDDGTVTIHVWAFDEEDAINRVQKLTDSEEFRRVKDANGNRIVNFDGVV